jgi:hypothetical protein
MRTSQPVPRVSDLWLSGGALTCSGPMCSRCHRIDRAVVSAGGNRHPAIVRPVIGVVSILAVALLPVTAQAADVESFLRLEAGGVTDTLSATVGQPVKIRLTLPGGVRWTEANIGRLVVRTHGVQRRVAPTPAAGTDFLQYTFSEPGSAIMILAAGPPEQKGKSDSWQRTTYCTKLFIRVKADGDAAGAARDPGQTAKAGTRIELLPLIAPTTLRVGDDIPVRAYFNAGGQKGVIVAAHRPDGSTEEKKTDSVGTTHFRINVPGKWIVRYEHKADATTYIGEVVFEVPAEASKKGEER